MVRDICINSHRDSRSVAVKQVHNMDDRAVQIVRTVNSIKHIPSFSVFDLLAQTVGRSYANSYRANGSIGGKATGIKKIAISNARFEKHLKTILSMRSRGSTIEQISKVIGIHESSVKRYFYRNGIK
jgi:hypothetical protein